MRHRKCRGTSISIFGGFKIRLKHYLWMASNSQKEIINYGKSI